MGVFVEKNYMFNSHNIVSLLPKTPIEKSLDIIKDRLQKDSSLRNRTKFNVEDKF